MIKLVANLVLTVMASGLIATITILWDSKVSRAEYLELKGKLEKDIAVIRANTTNIKDDISEIKERLK